MFGENYPIKYLPKRDGEMRTTLCDITQAKKKIDYVPNIDLEDYVKVWIEENNNRT